MEKVNTTEQDPLRVTWDQLEAWARGKVQELIQTLREEEITELLGRGRSQRREHVDSLPGYRNGYGKERNLTLSCGTITLRRPWVRGIEGKFESRVLPLFSQRTPEVNQLIPELYLHGLAQAAPWLGSRRAGRGNWPSGKSALWRVWKWCTGGWMGCT